MEEGVFKMNIFPFIILFLVLALLVTFVIRFIVKKSSSAVESNVKIGYFHHNGNLDFYITTDGHFISRTDNRSFLLSSVDKVTASADEQILFSKTKEETILNQQHIDTVFNQYVNHITYQFHFKDGEIFESVVDVATGKRQKQREDIKLSFNKLINLLNVIELN